MLERFADNSKFTELYEIGEHGVHVVTRDDRAFRITALRSLNEHGSRYVAHYEEQVARKDGDEPTEYAWIDAIEMPDVLNADSAESALAQALSWVAERTT
jgi:hypothetical protein